MEGEASFKGWKGGASKSSDSINTHICNVLLEERIGLESIYLLEPELG